MHPQDARALAHVIPMGGMPETDRTIAIPVREKHCYFFCVLRVTRWANCLLPKPIAALPRPEPGGRRQTAQTPAAAPRP
jgi:hypothetical protein